ncbi:sensor histidine kinase [Aliagarivorans taiwanensis]|uniref:sensor histidine kinase n=1 Tax=Aliagarivorans taiwanensis TaxID=561966 RepID=UPI0003F9EC5C|nr:histidine kinase [Aliagarivorans taiwanensis]
MRSPECFNDYFRSLALTFTFSIGIAFVTQAIWEGPYWMHYMIALGYSFLGSTTGVTMALILPKLPHLMQQFVSVIITGVLGTWHASYWVGRMGGPTDFDFMLKVLGVAILFGLVFYAYFHQRVQRLHTENTIKQLELEKLKTEQALTLSQLKNLQSQIEPHFLFNTLANLKALIAIDPKQAEVLLERFTDLIRLTLKLSRQEQVSWKDEIACLDAYLDIQQIRLGGRLRYSIHVDPELDVHSQLPPMLLQPLVENAVCHGIEPKPEGGEVTISISQQPDSWKVEISDSGVGLNHSQQQGNGLAIGNIKQRLHSLFGVHAQLTLSPREPGTQATLELPCKP